MTLPAEGSQHLENGITTVGTDMTANKHHVFSFDQASNKQSNIFSIYRGMFILVENKLRHSNRFRWYHISQMMELLSARLRNGGSPYGCSYNVTSPRILIIPYGLEASDHPFAENHLNQTSIFVFKMWILGCIIPETNSSPVKIDPWKRRFLLETNNFRGRNC